MSVRIVDCKSFGKRGRVKCAISGTQCQWRETKWYPIRMDLVRGSQLNGIISAQIVSLHERDRPIY